MRISCHTWSFAGSVLLVLVGLAGVWQSLKLGIGYFVTLTALFFTGFVLLIGVVGVVRTLVERLRRLASTRISSSIWSFIGFALLVILAFGGVWGCMRLRISIYITLSLLVLVGLVLMVGIVGMVWSLIEWVVSGVAAWCGVKHLHPKIWVVKNLRPN